METLFLGASTWTYLQTCSLETALRRLKGLGYSRFDVLTIPPHLWPYDIDIAQRRALRDLLVSEGLSFDSLNLPSTDQNLCSVTPQMREYSVQQFLDTQMHRFDGMISGDPMQAATKLLAATVQREALVLTYNDVLMLLGVAFAVGLVLMPLVKNPRSALTADRH